MILCPRCEKPLEWHDDSGCRRRMSRRHFFFGMLAAALEAKIPKLGLPRLSLQKCGLDGKWNEIFGVALEHSVSGILHVRLVPWGGFAGQMPSGLVRIDVPGHAIGPDDRLRSVITDAPGFS